MFVNTILVIVSALLGTTLAMPSSPVSSVQKRSVTCLKLGASAKATWTNSAGKTCTYTGIVGSNYGTNSAGGDYSCNGRCGAGCSGTAVGNAYTQDCFTHDMCSYFENASGGSSDANCGDAYDNAVDDTLLGYADGCSLTNPSNAAVAPTASPVCS